MKTFVLILTTFLLIGCSGIPDFEVSSDDPYLSHNEGLLLHKEEPFSGYVVDHYYGGAVKSVTPYRNGLEEFVKVGYYPKGELMYERPYKNGEKNGVHKGYFADGSNRFIYYFENGLSVGTHQEWYASGQQAKLMNFKDGRPFGSQKVWRSDGKIRSNYVIREDGRRYGLVGMKRCKNLDIKEEEIKPLTAAIYETD
ncbi:MAG: hypothetical protein RIC35_12040 [Marinoscillum sp.]